MKQSFLRRSEGWPGPGCEQVGVAGEGQAMKKMMLRVALISSAALVAGPALADHSWGSYHWGRKANPFTLRVVDAVSSGWDPYLNTAISDWSQSDVLDLTKDDLTGVNPKKCTAITGKIVACNAAYGQRGWLGIASIWASGDHITKATTKLNDTYFGMATYNTPAWRRLVTCQEIAHDFGLDHQDENFNNGNLGSCMDYTSDPDGPPTNEHPNAHDFEQLEAIYAHLDSTNTYSSNAAATNFGIRAVGAQPAAPAASANDPGDGPADWGAAVHRDSKGRPDKYVLNLGNGQRKITHVVWAIGEGPKN